VSEVDVRGTILSSFTNVKSPFHLCLDSEGHVLVTDYHYNRILLLNSQLQLQCVLVDRNSLDNLSWPWRLCYNELTSQLYIVHGSDVVSVLNLL